MTTKFLLLTAAAFTGSAAATAPTLISDRTFHYTCLGDKKGGLQDPATLLR